MVDFSMNQPSTIQGWVRGAAILNFVVLVAKKKLRKEFIFFFFNIFEKKTFFFRVWRDLFYWMGSPSQGSYKERFYHYLNCVILVDHFKFIKKIIIRQHFDLNEL